MTPQRPTGPSTPPRATEPAVPVGRAGACSTSSARSGPALDGEARDRGRKDARPAGDQVVTVALLGHKADLGVMALGAGPVAAAAPADRRCTRPVSRSSAPTCRSPRCPSTRRAARGDEAGPPVPEPSARGQAGVLLLPDVEAPGRRRQLVRAATTTSGRSSCWATARWGARSRPGPAAHHRFDRARRLGVGRHAVRRPSRRPEGVRLRDALRRGVGPLRRVRPVLHRHGGRGRGRARQRPLR